MSKNELLWQACRKGDYDQVKSLLQDGADVDARDPDGETPLMRVSHLSNGIDQWYNVAQLLIEFGADVNANDKYGTPLIEAIHENNYPMAKLLIEKGADVNKLGPNNGRPVSPLKMARNKDESIIQLLRQHGAIDSTSEESRPPQPPNFLHDYTAAYQEEMMKHQIYEACKVDTCIEEIKRKLGASITDEELSKQLLQEAEKIARGKMQFMPTVRGNPSFDYDENGNNVLRVKTAPPELAIPYFDHILKLCPNNDYFKSEICKLIGGIAWIEGKQGNTEKAIEYNEKILTIDPNDAMAYYNIACYRVYQDRAKEALTYFQKAIEKKPDYAEAWCNSADIYFHFQDYVQSLFCAKQAKKYKDPYPAMDNLIARLEQMNMQHE